MNEWRAYAQAATSLAALTKAARDDIEQLASEQQERVKSLESSVQHKLNQTHVEKPANRFLARGRNTLKRVNGEHLLKAGEPSANSPTDRQPSPEEAAIKAEAALDELEKSVMKQKSPSDVFGFIGAAAGTLLAVAVVVLIIIQFI